VYQSLGEISVKAGDEVKQGALIAKAGRSELEKDLGVHLHFEVRENGTPVNPLALLDEEE
jgi:stage II sporulation protein Q